MLYIILKCSTAEEDIAMCPHIPAPDNGCIDFAEDKTAPFMIDTTAMYSCDPGYSLVGTALRTCVLDSPNGVWSPQEEPVCSRKYKCGKLG